MAISTLDSVRPMVACRAKAAVAAPFMLQNDIAGAIIHAMNTAAKLLAATRQNPNDWTMAKLLTVAKQHGLEVRSTGGSHHVFSHPSVKDPLSVPAHRPIKAVYIKRLVALIDQIQE